VFEGLAEYVLQEVRHGLGSPQKNRFRKPLSWLPFLAHPASLSSFLLQQQRVQAILPVAFAAVLMIRSTGGWQTASESAFPERRTVRFAKACPQV
jgi:hypothetical protein